MRMRGSEAISPTAHYTGYVWVRHGLSHPELATAQGRLLFETLRPAMMVSAALGGPTLESYLLARHRALDALLERAIREDGVAQVIEVACGLSPRGWRFANRYGPQLTYIETDLPAMVLRKRRALGRMGSLGEHHRVQELDALRDAGPGSLAALVGTLDPDAGLAIVTEGLIGYLAPGALERVWSRFARELGAFREGRYLSDIVFGSQATTSIHAFRFLVGAFVRGRHHLHFADSDEAAAALERAGFSHAVVQRAASLAPQDGARDPGGGLAHVLQAGVSDC